MKITKIGFIGCGNMARAMINGICNSSNSHLYNITASNRSINKLEELQKDFYNFNIKITQNNKEVAKNSNILILAIKPRFYKNVIHEISNIINPNTIIVSITIGYTLKDLEEFFLENKNIKIIRAMPNTPCMVSEGMSALCKNQYVSEDEIKTVVSLFKSFSKVEILDEYLFDSVVAVSGSAPAYVYMFIEALADGAVLQGMPREMAYKFAAQTVLGSAKMVLDTKTHPAQLKDNVCSPAGSTIEAIRVLEKNNFRSSIIEAMIASGNKSKD